MVYKQSRLPCPYLGRDHFIYSKAREQRTRGIRDTGQPCCGRVLLALTRGPHPASISSSRARPIPRSRASLLYNSSRIQSFPGSVCTCAAGLFASEPAECVAGPRPNNSLERTRVRRTMSLRSAKPGCSARSRYPAAIAWGQPETALVVSFFYRIPEEQVVLPLSGEEG